MIYQEQVMKIAQELAGYTLGGADKLRKAMGKKIKEEMVKHRSIFVDGAVERGSNAIQRPAFSTKWKNLLLTALTSRMRRLIR